jgi:mono/diheme cytochrome c family protein
MRPGFLFFSIFAMASVACAITPEETEFFEKRVRPVLAEQCYSCHGEKKTKADLRLDSRAAILKGSDLGPVVVAGKPEESSLIKSIRHEGDSKMPEKADKLPDEQIAALAEWVKIGMPWPENDRPATAGAEEAAKSHWSWQTLRKPAVPEVKDQSGWSKSELDRFVLTKLEEKGIAPSPLAPKRTLIRRATFDLTGLPPTAEEIDAFEKDNSPDAFAQLVDRLLASPRYGERWGRYWLDVARYADTKGYVFQEERRYAFSYTYRDWVIRAFNEDLPYDQFVIQQLAGDQVATAEDPRPMAALGFLTLGRRFLNSQPDIIDDRIDVASRGLMGLTVACARCHDHKFDPISQKDYYALYGVFASSKEPPPNELPVLPVERSSTDDAEFRKQLAEREAKMAEYLAGKSELLSWRLIASIGRPVLLPEGVAERTLDRAGKDGYRELRNKVEALYAGPLAPPRPMAMVDLPTPVTPRVFIRGNAGRPGDEVPRRFLTVLSNGDPKPFTKGSGRLELAQAIASKDNPLTARVMVNRVWNLHFGRGLVRTPGDFGVKGEAPTHPELLDWLASRFMEEGWSLKKLHRLIMLSAAYQQTSDDRPDATQADADNRLVWRMNRRRLDFESLRDSLLASCGQLDLTMGGRGVELAAAPFAKRRAVYGFIDRQNLPGVFRTFDFASPDATNPQRFVTSVPQQALFMMNSPFVLEQARSLVARPEFKKDTAYEEQIQELYRRVLSRPAEPAEVDAGLRFMMNAITNLDPERVEQPAWQYGYGRYDEAARRMEFKPLPHYTGSAWQGGKKLPDAKLGWVLLTPAGGHAGNDSAHAAVRRWTAPHDAVITVAGALRVPEPGGDGVLGRIVSSRSGELWKGQVTPKQSADVKLEGLKVQAGETLDFVVDCGGSHDSDGFEWAPQIRSEVGEWNAQTQFAGPSPKPATPMAPWERYAQVLLQTNEFAFVD